MSMLEHLLTHLPPDARRHFIRFWAFQLERLADVNSQASATDFELFIRMLKILEQQQREAQKIVKPQRSFRSKEVEIAYALYMEGVTDGLSAGEAWKKVWLEGTVTRYAFSTAKKKKIRDEFAPLIWPTLIV
jgi:hypothetical protein